MNNGSASEKLFTRWGSFFMHDLDAETLIASLKEDGVYVPDDVERLIRQVHRKGQQTSTKIPSLRRFDTIRLSPQDFGYASNVSTAEFLNPARLAKWSKENAHRLPRDCHVEMLSGQAGPYIRKQYTEQPLNESLCIAMPRIINPDTNFPCIYWLVRNERWGLQLLSHEAADSFEWYVDESMLFELAPH